MNSDGRGRMEWSPSWPLESRINLDRDTSPAKEIIIECDDKDTADNLRNLLEIGILLAYPSPSESPNELTTTEVSEHSAWMMKDESLSRRFSFHENALFACNVAKRAWTTTNVVYAMEKYRMSLSIDSFTPHSASPMYGQVFMNERDDYRYHVNAGYAIVVAFSVLEELGLEIRSSAQKPRFKDDDWNDAVYDDVATRLGNAGIDPEEEFTWIMRGSPTDLQADAWQHLRTVDQFSDSGEVRDVDITIVEALHIASVIRNFIFAHRFGEVAKAVSPYDVHNMQLLARRLILGAMGLYKVEDPQITGLCRPS